MEKNEVGGADSDGDGDSQGGSSASAASNGESHTHDGQYETDRWSRNFGPHIYDIARGVRAAFAQVFDVATEFLIIHCLRISVSYFEIFRFFRKPQFFSLKSLLFDFSLAHKVVDHALLEFPMFLCRKPNHLICINALR